MCHILEHLVHLWQDLHSDQGAGQQVARTPNSRENRMLDGAVNITFTLASRKPCVSVLIS